MVGSYRNINAINCVVHTIGPGAIQIKGGAGPTNTPIMGISFVTHASSQASSDNSAGLLEFIDFTSTLNKTYTDRTIKAYLVFLWHREGSDYPKDADNEWIECTDSNQTKTYMSDNATRWTIVYNSKSINITNNLSWYDKGGTVIVFGS